jgi:hypothetical protein
MTKARKLLDRFLSMPKDLTYTELTRLLQGYGYKEATTGRTSGSRVAFINQETKHIIRLHKPHPEPFLKRYQMEDVMKELRRAGVLP